MSDTESKVSNVKIPEMENYTLQIVEPIMK